MFLAWRTHLRAAQQASELGRLDEAAQRVAAHELRQYKPGEDFARQLALEYLGRALRRAEEDNLAGACHDLAQAKTLGGADEVWLDAQTRLSKLVLRTVERLLIAGDYSAAQQRLVQFEKQPLTSDVLRASQEAIRRLESAANLAKRGKFREAEEQLAPAIALRPEWNVLCEKLEDVGRQANEPRPIASAVATETAPQAWPALADVRFMLWVDGVGGFLVCLADEVWIGQAGAGSDVAIGIQAELSRKHAKLTRSGDGYVIEAAHPVAIDGRPIVGKRVLIDGDELELGRGVRVRFRQPHSLSATARLEMVSRHRLQPHCDAIVLMAESCVLGPKWQDHIICKDWANDVVLYRQQERLFCRMSEPTQIDGVTYESRGPVLPSSHVASSDGSFSLELL
jgi:hypothetical protein